MTNDSLKPSRISAKPFDQDAFDAVPDAGTAGTCPECRVGRCGRCQDPGCTCPHPFAAIGRAVVELDESIYRARRLLGELRGTPGTAGRSIEDRADMVSAGQTRVGGGHDDPTRPDAD